MPKPFDDCVKAGGEVRTKTLKGGRYIRLCKLGGKWHQGYVKKKKKQ
ncbi:MAG TPA: hypothetical protein VMW52_12025 [Phycisphaerae bacterium]|nr:hypothetical protein [Phycisphaerae bacterium]